MAAIKKPPNNPTYSTNPSPGYLPQGLVEPSWRRVRQVRRVYLELLPPGMGPYFFPGRSYYLPVNFEGDSNRASVDLSCELAKRKCCDH
jgi:hypothetical protein